MHTLDSFQTENLTFYLQYHYLMDMTGKPFMTNCYFSICLHSKRWSNIVICEAIISHIIYIIHSTMKYIICIHISNSQSQKKSPCTSAPNFVTIVTTVIITIATANVCVIFSPCTPHSLSLWCWIAVLECCWFSALFLWQFGSHTRSRDVWSLVRGSGTPCVRRFYLGSRQLYTSTTDIQLLAVKSTNTWSS